MAGSHNTDHFAYARPINVSLTPTLEAFVRCKVAEGLYGNASEVVRAALRRQIEAEEATPKVLPLTDLAPRLRELEPRLRARGVAAPPPARSRSSTLS